MTSFSAHSFPPQRGFILLILAPVSAGDRRGVCGMCVSVCACVRAPVCACAPSYPRRNREIIPVPSAFPRPGLGVFPLTHLKPGTYISFGTPDTLCFLPLCFVVVVAVLFLPL